MSASTRSYQQADTGNLNSYISGKIKDAAQMAAEERRFAKQQEEAQREEGVPEEEITKYDKGYFFGKALSHQFGGDLIRRTKGTLSSDPSKQEDPSLTSRQRFSALIRSDKPIIQPYRQLELPLQEGEAKNAVEVEDKSLKSWLSVLFNQIEKSNSSLRKKIETIKDDKTDNSPDDNTDTEKNSLKKIFSVVQTVKDYFNKNNDLKKEENDLKEQQLEFQFEARDKQETAVSESKLESTQDVNKTRGFVDPTGKVYLDGETDTNEDSGDSNDQVINQDPNDQKESKKSGGFFNTLGSIFGGNKGGGAPPMTPPIPPTKMSEGGLVTPSYTSNLITNNNAINNSRSSNVVKSSTVTSNTKIIPSPVGSSRSTKMAAGGIVDNPTKMSLPNNAGVIPLNRNNPVKNMLSQMNINNRMIAGNPLDRTGQGKGQAKPLGLAVQLPTIASGGMLLSTMSYVFKKMGMLGQVIKPFFMQQMAALPRIFGLPTSIIGSMFGGEPAAAATLNLKDIEKFLKGKKGKKEGKSGGGGAPTQPPPGTGNLSAAPSGKETDIQSLQGSAGAPIDLSSSSTISNTGLHHGDTDFRGGVRVRDYFIGGNTGPPDGRDGLGAKLYTPLGMGPLKYVDAGPHGIAFQDPTTGRQVGMYWHVNDAQHQLNGQVVQPGTFVGTQGGLPGTPSAAPRSDTVHLHVEGTDDFHNAVIKTYADGNILKVAGGATGAHTANANQPSNIPSRTNSPTSPVQNGSTAQSPATAPATTPSPAASIVPVPMGIAQSGRPPASALGGQGTRGFSVFDVNNPHPAFTNLW